MAASEARTNWQCSTRCCFVQEDAKRASKLDGCPSPLSRSQYYRGSGDVANGTSEPSLNVMPLNWNPVNTSLPSDTKWWLQLQPNCGYKKDDVYKQIYALDDKLKEKITMNDDFSSTLLPGLRTDSGIDKNAYQRSPKMVSTVIKKHNFQPNYDELKAVSANLRQPLVQKTDLSTWYETGQLMDQLAIDQLIPKKPDKNYFDLELQFVKDRKTDPFWRTADEDELASLVAQRSLEHIENCDLPQPQKVHVSNDLFSIIEDFDKHGSSSPSLCQKRHTGLHNRVNFSTSTCQNLDGNCYSFNALGRIDHDSEKFSSNIPADDVASKVSQKTMYASEDDSSKSQLLKALCHSQTRARKAEIAAQKAYNEKEHIIKLFLRQASHLFAYKQWIHLLQLENLCLQLKIKENQISSLLNRNYNGEDDNESEARRKGKRRKKCHSCRYMFAFAVGVGLVGAGLLLGWTVGWLLSMF